MSISLPLLGGCVCGAVRYSVHALPLAVFVCHCRNCQKRTGSAFSLSMLTRSADFKLLCGETVRCETVGGSGAKHQQNVCAACFARTHSESLAYPDIVNVRPGTLDDPHVVAPIAQVWAASAQSWSVVADLRCFEENPMDVPQLIEEWRARHA